MKLVIGHELWSEKMLDHLQFLSERNCSPLSIDGKLPESQALSKLVRAVAHRRFEAPSMMTKARYALVPNLISS